MNTKKESLGQLVLLYGLLVIGEYAANYVLHWLVSGKDFQVFLSVVLAIAWLIATFTGGRIARKRMKNSTTTWGKIIHGLMVYILYSGVAWMLFGFGWWLLEMI